MIDAPPVAAAAFAPLGLFEHRTGRAVVGRPTELAAIEDGIAGAEGGRLTALTVEGEPGIGKTRLLLAAREIAMTRGFLTIAVGADEELRGPFLLARSILGSPEVSEAVSGSASEQAILAAGAALGGRDDPAFAGMSSDQRLLRSFDLATMAVRALTAGQPLALLIDDMQWADEDSLRLLRYVIRTEGASPIFLMFSIRPEELATLTEAVTLIADMERMRVIRRLKLARFSVVETSEFLRQVLGGQVDPTTASTIHGQAEGVPFIVEEIARAYREAGMLAQGGGDTWALGRNAERLAPSAVRTLIQRRAAHLPVESKTALAEAALMGRNFSLKDLREVRLRIGEGGSDGDAVALGDLMAPAVAAGLLVQQPEDSPADYSFPHEQVREFAADTLAPARRREIHGAIVQLLLTGEPAPETLPLLAHHARAAGDAQVCVRFSIDAAAAALAAHAPEEVLRVVEIALPQAATPQERLGLLTARDDALAMLRRPADRLEGLSELAALVEALGDPAVDLDVTLRRSAALRLSQQEDQAAELATRVRTLAVERGDRAAELAACVALGQAVLHAGLGEGFTPSAAEVDLDAAEEAYARAAELAEELGDIPMLAAATRELGVVDLGRVRGWFVEQMMVGAHVPVMERVAAGEAIEDLVEELPVAPVGEVGRRAPASRPRPVRGARRPSGDDGVDHRDGLPELGSRHPHRRGLRPPHRGDPAARIATRLVHEREPACLRRGPDALRRARVRASEGDPGSRALARRGGLRTRAGDRRPAARVPLGRRHRDVERGARRRRRGDHVARSCRRRRARESDAVARAPAGALARAPRRRARRGRRDASASRTCGPDGGRPGTAGGAVRGAGVPRARGGLPRRRAR